MKHYKVTIKERNNERLLTSEMIGDYSREDVIRHLGLNMPDVEWYEIEEC